MNGNTAVAVRGPARIGAMVRSATSIYIYWRGVSGTRLRLIDLSGRPRPERLDGCGERVLPLADDQLEAYLHGLLPGHLYCAEVGTLEDGCFEPLLGTAPVQTPWQGRADRSAFPSPYHRS